MEFRVLGPLEIADRGEPLTVKGPKQRVLLCALLLRPGEALSDDLLAELIWQDDLPAKPQNALQAQVSQLRRVLGAEAIVQRRGPGYALNAQLVDTDADRFERGVSTARDLHERGHGAEALFELDRALASWRGTPFADVADRDHFRGAVTRLTDLRIAAFELRVDLWLDAGRHADAVAELEQLTQRYPFRERFWAQRMIGLYRCGRQSEALRTYAEARALLVDELGIEPGPELREIEAKVLRHDESLAIATPSATVVLGPQRAVRSGSDEAPTSPARLRLMLTSFIGREAERAAIEDRLTTARLVTLVGPGGVGKTRLALEVARLSEQQWDDGACFADLAPLSDRDSTVGAVATAAGVLQSRDPASAPITDQNLLRQLIDHIGRRSMLIVLDNCEHLIDHVASMAAELLGACPGLRLLATSREVLRVPGEEVVVVEPLRDLEAEALFLDRASSAGASIVGDQSAVISELCRRLDGLPLAIELAAARSRVLTPDDLLARLDDRFAVLTGGARTSLPRQQTMRSVVDWSYDLLFEDERCLFRRLAVFAAPFTLEAAVAVCADETLPALDIVDVLAHLVDRSLLVAEVGTDAVMRYRQLQTLKDYARDRLQSAGEAAALEAAHARWFLDVAIRAEGQLRSGEAPGCRQRLEAELPDLRATLDHFIDAGAGEEAMRLTVALAWMWFLRSDWAEGRRWLDDALAVGATAQPWQGLALAWFGYFGGFIGVPRKEALRSEEGVALLRGAADDYRLSEGLLLLASVRLRGGELAEALDVLGEARGLIEALDDPWVLAILELLTASALLRSGQIGDGTAAADRCIAKLREVGDPYLLTEALVHRGFAAETVGDEAAMLAAYEEAARLPRALDAPGYLSMSLTRLANAYTTLGRLEEADRLHEESIALRTNPLTHAFALLGRAVTARHAGRAAAAEVDLAEALSLYESIEQDDGVVSCLIEQAWCAYEVGRGTDALARAARAAVLGRDQPDPRVGVAAIEALAAAVTLDGRDVDAARLLAAAADRRRSAGLPPTQPEARILQQLRDAVAERLGADVFASVMADPPPNEDDILGLIVR